MQNEKRRFKNKIRGSLLFLLIVMALCFFWGVSDMFAQETTERNMSSEQAEVLKFALIGAAIAFGFGAIGAGIAIAHVGAAAMGAIGEKPEIAGQALIFIALAEGLVVFGFITALMILGKV
jgi:V/A-type H+-transporting ATPase subunit K